MIAPSEILIWMLPFFIELFSAAMLLLIAVIPVVLIGALISALTPEEK